MDKSKFLAKVMGIYLVIISILMLMDRNNWTALIGNMLNDPTLIFVLGFFILILGIMVIVSHNIWQWNWRVLVTMIGWILFLKGICCIASPSFIDRLANLYLTNMCFYYICAMVDLFLGLLLSYLGYRRE